MFYIYISSQAWQCRSKQKLKWLMLLKGYSWDSMPKLIDATNFFSSGKTQFNTAVALLSWHKMNGRLRGFRLSHRWVRRAGCLGCCDWRLLPTLPAWQILSKHLHIWRNRAFFVSQGVASVEIVGIEMLFLLRITSLHPAYCRKRLFLYIRCNRWGCGEIKAVHYFVLPLPCTIFAIWNGVRGLWASAQVIYRLWQIWI